MGVVFMGVITTCVVSFVFDMPMSTMVGILSGAVTNTPGLGAASQTYFDIFGKDDPTISLGYAVAYPLGVIGVISSMIIIKAVFRISFEREMKEIEARSGAKEGAMRISIVMANPSLFGKKVDDVVRLAAKRFVISRVCDRDGHIEVACAETVLAARATKSSWFATTKTPTSSARSSARESTWSGRSSIRGLKRAA